MKIFLDTAEIEEIRTAARWGVLDGVTTNPTLYAKVGGSYDALLAEICKITSGGSCRSESMMATASPSAKSHPGRSQSVSS